MMAAAGNPQVSVSMFNVGFGDCFLVEIPTAGRTMRILFDCGRHKGGQSENQDLADQVIGAATDADGTKRIDLVVATHRHKDHVSGFAANGWQDVEVAEVWMPWTEDPADPAARGLAARQVEAAKSALAACEAAANRKGAAGDGIEGQRAALMGLALSNEAAMETLYRGFAGQPRRRYLPDREAPLDPIVLPGFPGIRIWALGPSRDESTLAVMDPPKAETFRKLAAAEAGDAAPHSSLQPFPASWRRDPAEPGPALPAKHEQAIQNLSGAGTLAALSAAVDQAINNTSLVLMIEAGKAMLLFCADAQWGNWQGILARKEWRELIGRTTFLKVGHHASHNASPVSLVDKLLPQGIPAMVSVDPDAYSSVPYPGLLDAFARNGFELARSDQWEKASPPYAGTDKVVTLSLDM